MRVVALPRIAAGSASGSANCGQQRRVVQVGGEAGQQVAERLGGLAHHGGGGDLAEGVEGGGHPVAVGVGDRRGRSTR